MTTSHATKGLMEFDRYHPAQRFYITPLPVSTDEILSPRYHVRVFDKNHSVTDPVYEYDRDYEMLDTFEPFRLFADNHWHYYALLSSDYLSFEVLDLESGTICAKIRHPRLGEKAADHLNSLLRRVKPSLQVSAGDEQRCGSFMPTEFYVPDILDILKPTGLTEETVTNFVTRRTHGFVTSGSVWEEKDSLVTRKVHLTGIPDGKVSMSDPIPPQNATL